MSDRLFFQIAWLLTFGITLAVTGAWALMERFIERFIVKERRHW